MAGLPLVAGGAGGEADPPVAEETDNHLALIAGEGHRQNVGGRPAPNGLQPGDRLLQPGQGLRLQPGHVPDVPLPGGRSRPHRRGEGRDLGGGLCAGAQASLLASPPDQGGQLQPPADIQGPDPLRRVDLVPAHSQQVHPQLRRGEGELQEALHPVAVEEGGAAQPPDQLGGLGHRQHRAQLVVHQYHGHQHRVRPQSGLQLLQGDIPLPVGAEVGHLIPLPLQLPAGLQHRGVLNGGGDDVAPTALSQLHRPPDGPVVPLGAAGGEEHLLRPAAQAGGHISAPAGHTVCRLTAQGIAGGGVAPPLCHGLHRRLDRLRADRGGGRIVKIVDQCRSPLSVLSILCPAPGKVKQTGLSAVTPRPPPAAGAGSRPPGPSPPHGPRCTPSPCSG